MQTGIYSFACPMPYTYLQIKMVLHRVAIKSHFKLPRKVSTVVYQYKYFFRTVLLSCWILGEHGDKEKISNGGINLIKTLLKMKDRRVKYVFSGGGYQEGW
jgi:hypothetical protein